MMAVRHHLAWSGCYRIAERALATQYFTKKALQNALAPGGKMAYQECRALGVWEG